MGQDKMVGRDPSFVTCAKKLEADLFAFARLDLYIGHLMRSDRDLAKKLLAADGLNEKGAVVFGAEVPVKVIVVEEAGLWCPRPEDTVGVLGDPAPELGEWQRERALRRHGFGNPSSHWH